MSEPIPSSAAAEPDDELSEQWQKILTEGHGSMVRARHWFRYVPSAPRCKVCNNPFGGLGGRLFGLAGFSRSRKNPALCRRCCDALPPGGAEVDIAVLFADVRGSTGIGEHSAPAEFARLLDRFYAVAIATLVRNDAVVDKLMGDEVMAFFVEGIAGADYRRRAVRAGRELLRAVGYGSGEGPWLELGVAVNAGVTFVGNVGTAVVDFTALGDPVNVAARMQSCAGGGELLLRAGVADELAAGAPSRTLQLRGRGEPVDAFVLAA